MEELEQFLTDLAEQETDDSAAVDQLLNYLSKIPTARGFEEEAEEAMVGEMLVARGISYTRESGKDYEYLENEEVQNEAGTWDYCPAYYILPYSLQGLVNAIQFAESKDLRVRALGSRHSFSQTIAVPREKGCYIDMSKAHPYNPKRHKDTIGKVDQSSLSRLKAGIDKTKYFDTPAGAKVSMVNKMLYPDIGPVKTHYNSDERRLFNTGGGDIQAYAGAFSTGTHGSGGLFSTYHDTIRSILLVASGGRVFRIEPTNGITDPVEHLAYYETHEEEVPVELIQDDDKFYAAIVSMGCFGVIHSVIIRFNSVDCIPTHPAHQVYGCLPLSICFLPLLL